MKFPNLAHIIVTGLVTIILSPPVAVSQTADSEKKPNILLIMADDLGYETVGYGGGTSYRTPHLDDLARTGIWFENYHTSPVCSPSRVSMLTGRYAHQVTTRWAHLPDDAITFGSVLKAAGYKTALAGKWQLGRLERNPFQIREMGFDVNAAWGYGEGPRYWAPLIYRNGTPLTFDANIYGPDIFSEFLIDFMATNKTGPFLAFYPMCLVHDPKEWEPRGPDGRWKTYKERVEYLDKIVGKLVSSLDELGIRENTLILFTSDNGSPRKIISSVGNRAVRGGKGSLEDAGTRVPLIANWQGTTSPGTKNRELLHVADFMPTLIELAGAKRPDVKLDGTSFAPLLFGQEGVSRTWIYMQWRDSAWVRTKYWKLYEDGRLFDMFNDPYEESPIDKETTASAAARSELRPILEQHRTGLLRQMYRRVARPDDF